MRRLLFTFLFLGNRGDYELAAGPKVLLVASGGTLELHGRKKLSWTKLSKTIPKIDNSEELLYDHLVSNNRSWLNKFKTEQNFIMTLAYTTYHHTIVHILSRIEEHRQESEHIKYYCNRNKLTSFSIRNLKSYAWIIFTARLLSVFIYITLVFNNSIDLYILGCVYLWCRYICLSYI